MTRSGVRSSLAPPPFLKPGLSPGFFLARDRRSGCGLRLRRRLADARPADKSVAGGNVLTGPVFDVLPKFAGPKVIYAAANRMGGRAAREGITFKQTPYALEV